MEISNQYCLTSDYNNKRQSSTQRDLVENADLSYRTICQRIFGDYASGTNHVTPDIWSGKLVGLDILLFYEIDKLSRQLTKEVSWNLAPLCSSLCRSGGLDAHKNAVTIRRKKD